MQIDAKKEQWYFIRLLKDYVHQVPSEEPESGIDWQLLAGYAEEQNLSGIIYIQCRHMKSISKEAINKLNQGFLSDAYLAVNSEYAFDEISKLFDLNSIDYMPFKGSLYHSYYPCPELRTMGDRDILIRYEDRECADQVMTGLGYKKYIDNHAVWTYYKPNLMFEIHNAMFYENLSNQVDYRSYFIGIWSSAKPAENDGYVSSRFIPKAEMHFLYTIAHTAKHIINSGMGFRAFLDMAFFCLNAEKVDGREPDWEWIREELEKLQLYDFTAVCFTLCEYWFDVKMPFRKESMDPAFIERVTEKIFRDGIFGFANEDNIGARSAKEIKRSNTSYQTTSLKLTIKNLFPPYEDMQLIPWYSWVDGKPYLMPAAWVYRWIYCLIHKRKKGTELLLEPYQKRKKIEEREKYLENWGL